MRDRIGSILGLSLLGLFTILIGLTFFNVALPSSAWWSLAGLFLLSLIYYTLSQNLVVYVVKRFLEAIFVIWIIASATFLLLRIVPGGPFDSEKALPPEVKANIEAKYNLNAPLFEQYIDYLVKLTKGDLGESYKYLGRGVSEIVVETLPISVELGIYSLILSFMIGIPAGVYAASKHSQWQDSATMIAAISGVSLPSFLVAPILILIFCFWLGWFEPALWEGPTYYILPTIVLGTRSAAIIARLTRSSVLEVIRSDYIRTARSKGLSETKILYKHVLKNSLIPVLTFAGPLTAGILSGSFVVEQIFAIPGMGKHLVLSVSNRDYPLILATTLVFSVMLIFANLIVDILYAYFDPRIKLS